MLPRRRVFELHASLHRALGPHHAWTLLQLLRTANGNLPFDGRQVGPADVFELHAVLSGRLSPDAAWQLVELLREAHDGRLPNGTEWPARIHPDPEA